MSWLSPVAVANLDVDYGGVYAVDTGVMQACHGGRKDVNTEVIFILLLFDLRLRVLPSRDSIYHNHALLSSPVISFLFTAFT